MDYLSYREQLGIGFNDSQKSKYFFVKVLNQLNSIDGYVTYDEYFNFCNLTGTRIKCNLDDYEGDIDQDCVTILRYASSSLNNFLAHFVAFINSLDKKNKLPFCTRREMKSILVDMLSESHIPFELVDDSGEYFVFPKGAEELDDALVSQPLEWLKKYPNSQKAYAKVLKEYSNADEEQASGIADNLRKALETFCQEFFGGGKSLENYISDYGNYLQQKGVPTEISNEFIKLLDLYTKFNNNYAKHHDKTELNILEYIMYQTGNIIRLLITLKNSEKQ